MKTLPDVYLGASTNHEAPRWRINGDYFSHESGALARLINGGFSEQEAKEYLQVLYEEFNSRPV